MASEQFSLCWDNFHKNMSSGMNSLLESEDLVDVTIAVEGKFLKAHKMVLSVCSPYFKDLFKGMNPYQHPVIFMKDVSYVAISDLLQFMYQGEVQVSQENLTTFIKTAEALQIKGLTGDGNGSLENENEKSQTKNNNSTEPHITQMPRPKVQRPAPGPVVTSTPVAKKPRLSQSSEPAATLLPTKQEPVAPVQQEATAPPVHFKMEPYDQNQSVTIPDDDDQDTEQGFDDTHDDTEDYSMMEGDEQQAGTSADGAGEGQGEIFFRKGVRRPIMVIGEFEYKIERKTNSTNISWCCVRKEKTKCKARILTNGEKSVIIKHKYHNHQGTLKDNVPLKAQTINFVYAPSKERRPKPRKGGKIVNQKKIEVFDGFSSEKLTKDPQETIHFFVSPTVKDTDGNVEEDMGDNDYLLEDDEVVYKVSVMK